MRYLLSSLAGFLSCLSLVAAEPKPFLEYKQSGGGMQFGDVSIRILDSGETVVRMQIGEKKELEHKTQLSPEELEMFRVTARAVDFSQQTFSNTGPRLHAPDVEIQISDGEGSRGLKGTWPRECAPLEILIYRLILQARSLHAIENDGDIYTAIGAVKKSHAGVRAIQPAQFRKPLMEYVRTHRDRQRVNWALQALADVTTPDEFAGFVSSESRKRADKASLLDMDAKGWIPDSHFLALCPLYLAFIREHMDKHASLSPEKKWLFEVSVRGIREARYAPAIPALIHCFHKRPGFHVPLDSMGLPGLEATIPLLGKGDEEHRVDAIELVSTASLMNPDNGGGVSEYEYDQMRKLFTSHALPALRKAAEEDASKNVREAATKAIEMIQVQIAK